MLYFEIIRENADYTIGKPYGKDSISINLWFQPSTGRCIDAYSKNHAELIAKEPEKFGITKKEFNELRRRDDFEEDWNESSIKLANKHGWVRLKIQGGVDHPSMQVQSSNQHDMWLTVKKFAAEYDPAEVFLDDEVQYYDTIWHEKLEGKSLRAYLRTGQSPKVG